jgi:AdoMet-dependent heme synthase
MAHPHGAARANGTSHPLTFASLDFAVSPFLVIWEVTRACPLLCRHCRAEAVHERDPAELSTEEGKALLGQMRDLGTPVCVLTGGDPARRPDLAELVRHGTDLGLRMATIPVASELLTRSDLQALRDAGVAQLAFSLDGPNAEVHDGFRQVPGTFDLTLRAIDWAHQLGIPLQINTTYCRYNAEHIEETTALIERLGIVFWEVFSLVPVGRGSVLEPLDADEHEALFSRLYSLSERSSFVIKVTEAPHYRRFVLERRRLAARTGTEVAVHAAPASGSAIPAQLSRELSVRDSLGARSQGINAGKGFVFVSHTGEVFPSGFLPLPVGNVRQRQLSELYRDSPLLKTLRDASRLEGRCGCCEYADICGGSRARAYATTGNLFAEDPACGYQPRGA